MAVVLVFCLVGAIRSVADTCKLAPVDGPHATVVVYRYQAFVGGGRHASIYVDEVKVCSLTNGRYLVIHLIPGPHKLRSSDPKHGGVEQEFKPDRIYYFRTHVEPTGFWQTRNFWVLNPVPTMQARVELRSTKAQDGENKPLPIPAVSAVEDQGVAEAPSRDPVHPRNR
jgi:hypothetical protein